MGVDYEELAGSPSENWTKDGFNATVELKCAWSDRNALVAELAASGGMLYPHNTSTGARAVSCVIAPFGECQTNSPGSWSTYDFAQVSVTFDNTRDADNFCAESIQPSAEFMQIPYEDFRWGSSSGTPISAEEAPGKLVLGLAYNLEFYNVPTLPAGILPCVGCCNSASLAAYSLGLTFAAQTLLYNPPDMNRTIKWDLTGKWTIKYSFVYRPSTWNKFWNAATGTWVYMYHKDSGDVPYLNFPTADFTTLMPAYS